MTTTNATGSAPASTLPALRAALTRPHYSARHMKWTRWQSLTLALVNRSGAAPASADAPSTDGLWIGRPVSDEERAGAYVDDVSGVKNPLPDAERAPADCLTDAGYVWARLPDGVSEAGAVALLSAMAGERLTIRTSDEWATLATRSSAKGARQERADAVKALTSAIGVLANCDASDDAIVSATMAKLGTPSATRLATLGGLTALLKGTQATLLALCASPVELVASNARALRDALTPAPAQTPPATPPAGADAPTPPAPPAVESGAQTPPAGDAPQTGADAGATPPADATPPAVESVAQTPAPADARQTGGRKRGR